MNWLTRKAISHSFPPDDSYLSIVKHLSSQLYCGHLCHCCLKEWMHSSHRVVKLIRPTVDFYSSRSWQWKIQKIINSKYLCPTTLKSVLYDTHMITFWAYLLLFLLLLFVYCMMENGGRWELLSKVVPFLQKLSFALLSSWYNKYTPYVALVFRWIVFLTSLFYNSDIDYNFHVWFSVLC